MTYKVKILNETISVDAHNCKFDKDFVVFVKYVPIDGCAKEICVKALRNTDITKI